MHINQSYSDALDIGRWELPVGRKGGASETWELVWKQEEGSGKLQRLIIEGSVGACTMITRHIEAWHTLPPQPMGPAARSQPSSTRMGASTPQETASNERAPQQGEQGMDAPLHLVPGSVMPTLSEPSQLLEESQVRVLCCSDPCEKEDVHAVLLLQGATLLLTTFGMHVFVTDSGTGDGAADALSPVQHVVARVQHPAPWHFPADALPTSPKRVAHAAGRARQWWVPVWGLLQRAVARGGSVLWHRGDVCLPTAGAELLRETVSTCS